VSDLESGLDATIADQLLDALHDVGSYTPAPPVEVRLMTVLGDSDSPGTEVNGGSYAPQEITFGSASGGEVSNTGEIEFTDLPSATVVGIEIWDSDTTPRRIWWGALAEPRTVPAGGTLRFAIGEIVVSFTMAS